MAETDHLRISDRDRELAATAIREHYAEGRLDGAEFEERLQAVYAARTRGELATLSADLPALPAPAPTPMEVARRAFDTSQLVQGAAGGVGLFLVSTAIWALTGAGSSFWPKWVLVVTLVSVVRGIRRGARGR
ncbi:MAG TPA: DUF1707 domain-containing protein [Solirubrobacteraceae bacterium]|nr:DUF1707 domain-containing protein [Solirubrobacteraceae bacterium]